MDKQNRRVKELEERLLKETRLGERLNNELSILKVRLFGSDSKSESVNLWFVSAACMCVRATRSDAKLSLLNVIVIHNDTKSLLAH